METGRPMNTTIAPRTPKQERSAQFSMGFSCIGHTYAHLFTPIFFTLVPLALEDEFGLSHGETVALIFVGNLLFGLAAPLAGWLADRWTATGMMAIFYVGTGAAMIMCGMVESPLALGFWLAMTGLFASIYHPVGIAWLVRESVNTGTVLGVNGIFGSLGTAAAAVMAGWLVHLYGWRSAYILPGIVVIVTGLVFTGLLIKGVIIESKADRKPPPPPSTRGETMRVYTILVVTLACGGIIYNATNPALPKAFALDFGADGDGVLMVSYLIGLVYTCATVLQIIGGRCADKFSARRVYLIGYLLQVPILMAFGMFDGPTIVLIAIVMTGLNTATQPAENILIARYTPFSRRGLIFGLKFVVAIGISSLGVLLEGFMFDLTGGFFWLFVVLGGLAAIGAVAALLLPSESISAIPQPAE